jgi:hypothetical protein
VIYNEGVRSLQQMKDFFISYNQADREPAEWIARELVDAGYSVVIQAWDILPGDNFVLAMHRFASQAERTIAVLSPDYLTSLYTAPEWAAAFAQDPTGEKRTFIPVRVRECALVGLLRQIVYIDLLGRNDAEARMALLQGVRHASLRTASPRIGLPKGIPKVFIGNSHDAPEHADQVLSLAIGLHCEGMAATKTAQDAGKSVSGQQESVSPQKRPNRRMAILGVVVALLSGFLALIAFWLLIYAPLLGRSSADPQHGDGAVTAEDEDKNALTIPRQPDGASHLDHTGLPMATFGSSGDDTLDVKIGLIHAAVDNALGLRTDCEFFDDGETPNAFAVAGADDPEYHAVHDGTVVIGIKLAKRLLKVGSDDSSIAGHTTLLMVVAHEAVHLLQRKNNMALTARQKELHADFVAGWCAARFLRATLSDADARQGALLNVLTFVFQVGDYQLDEPTHGSPKERLDAASAGFGLERENGPNKVYEKGIEYVQHRF